MQHHLVSGPGLCLIQGEGGATGVSRAHHNMLWACVGLSYFFTKHSHADVHFQNLISVTSVRSEPELLPVAALVCVFSMVYIHTEVSPGWELASPRLPSLRKRLFSEHGAGVPLYTLLTECGRVVDE